MFSRLSHSVLATGSRVAPRIAHMSSKGTASSANAVFKAMISGVALGVTALVSASEYGSLQNTIDTSEVSALSKEEYRKFRVRRVEQVGPNTKKIMLQLPEGKLLGTWPVSTVSVKAVVNNKEIEKQYAPVSPWNSVKAEIIVKYRPDDESNPSKLLDRYLSNLKSGDVVELKGPHELMQYKPNSYRKIGMIAGSTGIAPLIQVIQEAMFSAWDYTKITVILCNESAADILLRDELDTLQELYPARLDVYHVVDQPPNGWRMGTILDEAVISEVMPTARETREGEAIIMVSGPDGLIKAVTGEAEFGGLLKKLNYEPKHVMKFPSS